MSKRDLDEQEERAVFKEAQARLFPGSILEFIPVDWKPGINIFVDLYQPCRLGQTQPVSLVLESPKMFVVTDTNPTIIVGVFQTRNFVSLLDLGNDKSYFMEVCPSYSSVNGAFSSKHCSIFIDGKQIK